MSLSSEIYLFDIYYISFIQPCPKRGERFPARLYLYARHSFFPYRLKICTTSKESLIFSPLDCRIAEEPFQRFFGFFGKVYIEFWHHADLLP